MVYGAQPQTAEMLGVKKIWGLAINLSDAELL